jgi:DNA-binding CsgD family transcriptional regulator
VANITAVQVGNHRQSVWRSEETRRGSKKNGGEQELHERYDLWMKRVLGEVTERLEGAREYVTRFGALQHAQGQAVLQIVDYLVGTGLEAAAQGATAERIAVPSLTRRQLEILRLLGEDLLPAEIARTLLISERTVRNHTAEICARLGVTRYRDAVRVARELNLIR